MVMIPQLHDNKTQGEEQIPSPVENKQMPTPLGKRSEPAPASPQRWIGVLLFILSIVLPFAGGFLIGWPWQYRDAVEMNEFIIIMIFGGVALAVFVGARASLLRSWWALLIVPVAWSAGWILARHILLPLVYGWYCGYISDITCPYSGLYDPGWSALQAWFETGIIWRNLGIGLPIAILPIILCTALGAGVGIFLREWLGKRRQQC
jgi:hypothetical protein